ncbi:MAG TPA: glucoamylase family protein [Bryobacteraceae bacterium]|nr:glucoamylase family protein [Bryobacteraceae bacterium]
MACTAAGLSLGAARRTSQPEPISPQLDQLLDEIERRACRYFCEESHPATGQVRDRARTVGTDSRRVSSVAATGFGLSMLAIADRRGYLPRGEAEARVRGTLEFLARHPGHHRGFFYHFMDMSTGERVWDCELSSVDTAWLLCGALHARMHFDTPQIRRAADDLISRVDWRWMLNGAETLSHGWTPEHGFLPYRWDCYSELKAMYLMAVGSGDTRLPASSWYAWNRPVRTYHEFTYIDSAAPLFTHQYSHAWFDFRGRRDRYANYFENSRAATGAHRKMCIEMSRQYPWYGPDMWGVTASDSILGYQAWGGSGYPPDGTLVPCAAGGSLPFLPRECGAVLATMLQRYGARAWGRYGFVDAFLPGQEWYSPDVIGIDLGIMGLMAENARTGNVWREFMAAPEARRAMKAVGLG